MQQEAVKDFSGKIIAWYEYQPNGDIIVRDFYGKILGKYVKSDNTTRDFYGKILFRGNCVGMLLK